MHNPKSKEPFINHRNTSPHIPPLLEELTEKQLTTLAFLSTLHDDPKLLHLATMLDSNELLQLLLTYSGALLSVPPVKLLDQIRNTVLAVSQVHTGQLTVPEASKLHRVPKKDISAVLEVVEPPMQAFEEHCRRCAGSRFSVSTGTLFCRPVPRRLRRGPRSGLMTRFPYPLLYTPVGNGNG